MIIRSMLGAITMVVTLSGVVQAQLFPPGGGLDLLGLAPATLFTPPLQFCGVICGGASEVQSFVCHLANVSNSSRTVRLQIIDPAGEVHEDSGNITLLARRGKTISTAVSNRYYCKFTVHGPKTDVRGAATISEITDPPTTLGESRDLVALPAQ